MKKSKVIDSYYNYCLNGWLPEASKKYISVLNKESAFQEKILSMFVYATGQSSEEYCHIENEKREKSIVLNDIAKSSELKNSVLVLKGLSVERFYHESASRFAFDADLVVLEDHLPLLDALLIKHGYDIYFSTIWIKDVVTEKVYKSFRYTKGKDDDRGFEIHVDHYPIDDNGSRILLQSLYSGCYNTILRGTYVNVVSDLNSILIILIQIYNKDYLTIRDFVDLLILLENSDFKACEHIVRTLISSHGLGPAIAKLRQYIEANEIDVSKYPSGADIVKMVSWELSTPDVPQFDKKCVALISDDPTAKSRELFDRGTPTRFYRLFKNEKVDESNSFKMETNIGCFYGQVTGDFVVYE
ncbi:hypothetical protein GPY51_03695 [Photorhabdus laumondii subsp. laumondii]|uniref:Photorhabdus luminescens subsp. laumondii TTO1 complete genome segment 9/17 n=2 Tax=Photorhabdus laumondii subsp. laumondii TaxID=141679 RepID=Q7N4D5_PHOLL|nr:MULTISPECIES: nucleotidyltransferase family protein [Photorhabdus]AWK42164.1 hypothetical protein A4R40_12000 [Photorhabdus laumondii subsp. laumondii]AXG43025.1 hypothetical protein PluDJC_12715 [Photorhabdus laumondii subsp. laumondii]AXG47484.1 hypothetical protein PluTT01m_12375 [Photorhabdus laumondii subsp. laumondii]MCC8383796.1 nucleotidyltransferase family protein [Photorhabdus laumondii]MCC8388121.1 nucleotidyltransferase family protein [Photorhabdus laumondii]